MSSTGEIMQSVLIVVGRLAPIKEPWPRKVGVYSFWGGTDFHRGLITGLHIAPQQGYMASE